MTAAAPVGGFSPATRARELDEIMSEGRHHAMPAANRPGRRLYARMHRCEPALMLAALVWLGGAVGCQSVVAGRVSIRAFDDLYYVGTAWEAVVERGPLGNAAAGVTVTGSANETLGLGLVIAAGSTAVRAVSVSVNDARSGDDVIGADAFSFYRVLSVTVPRLPGWNHRTVPVGQRRRNVPDVLVPIHAPQEGLPVDLLPHGRLQLWMDVAVPATCPPGTYTTNLRIVSSGIVLQTVPLTVTVWPIVLPDDPKVVLATTVDHRQLFAHHVTIEGEPHAPKWSWSDSPRSAELDAVLLSAAAVLWSGKVCPVLDRLYPIVKTGVDRGVQIDWSEYDRVAGAFLDGNTSPDIGPVPIWRIPFDETFPPPPPYGALDSPAYSRLLREYLAACAAHFANHGWLERSAVVLPTGRASNANAFVRAEHFGRIARDADPRLRTRSALFPQDVSRFGWEGFEHHDITSYVDAWAPPAQFFDPPTMAAFRKRGEPAYWTLDRPPYSGSVHIAAPPPMTWAVPWQGRLHQLDGIMLGPAASWPPASQVPATPQECIDHDPRTLLYPGAFAGLKVPLASMRLVRLRRAMQDLAYGALLATRRRSYLVPILARSLCPYSGTESYGPHFAAGRRGAIVDDPSLWAMAHDILGGELHALSDDRSMTAPPTVADTVAWQRFMDATRGVRLVVEGVSVHPVDPRGDGALRVDCVVTLENRRRLTARGSIQFEELPPNWSAEPDAIQVDDIPPGARRRVTLSATADAMAWGRDGVRPLPIVFRRAQSPPLHASARLAYIGAVRPPQAITIDGDLSDWPRGIGNAAGGFRLICGETAGPNPTSAARPTLDTTCFVAADAAALYVAFNCQLDPHTRSTLPTGAQNWIAYQDLVPVGEDLVEVLIDPANTGTRSTSDLYHIAIKRTGAVLEHGIGAEPPPGTHRVWNARIKYAARVRDHRWLVEIRIPRSAFDPAAWERRLWRINFARFDATHQEYSHWAGVTPNVYDPSALGNMALP